MYGSLFYVLPILAVIAKTVFRAVLPLLIGCMIAYVVNILMCFYEKGYARICRMAAIAPLQRPLCMTLSYLSLVLVILILCPPEGPALQHKAPLYDPVRCVPRGDTAQLRIDFLAHTAAPFPVVFPAFYQLFSEKSREY